MDPKQPRSSAGDTAVKLVHELMWPAVAGNVLWTFAAMTIAPPGSPDTFWPRTLSLFWIGGYTVTAWAMSLTKESKDQPGYLLVEFAFAASLTAASHALYNDHARPTAFAAVVFLTALCGHLSGIWSLPGSRHSQRMKLIDGVAVILSLAANAGLDSTTQRHWSSFWVLSAVVILWGYSRALARRGQ